MEPSANAFEQTVHTIQFLSADAVQKANSGHPGTPMALAGITVDVFTRHLRYNPEDPAWPNRDRFVLSCGHASMLLYSTLHLAGYDLSLDDLVNFRQWGSKTPGHPEVGHTPGVETTTGPLGQGVGNAVGMALASKLQGARISDGAPLIDYRVFALCSDGDLMEGVAAEAASLAGQLKLDNLVMVYDDNKITIDGDTSITFTEDVGARFEAYGWFVQHADGHNPEQFRAALDAAVAERARPSLIVARTHIGIGAPTKQDTPDAHGAPLGESEIQGAKKNAGWPENEHFRIAPEALEVFAARKVENLELYAAWQARVSKLSGEGKEAFAAFLGERKAEDLLGKLCEGLEAKADATRSIAAKVEQQVAALCPRLVGGSADLAGSCKTTIKGAADVGPGAFSGRNMHFGIREHGMGSIMNGLALSGFVPFGSTFLIFSDYMRPSIRLAGLMEQQAIYVFTHDSVLLGEDGPTHQPIEQLAALRLIPNLHVVRPADAYECAFAWAHAMQRTSGPTAIVLSRQKVPELTRDGGLDLQAIARGAYVVSGDANADFCLMASGSEVGLAVDVAKALGEQGKTARVVSVPCLELFEALDVSARKSLLGSGKRVSLEAGRALPWKHLVGEDGVCISLEHFGASAPDKELAKQFGLTVDGVLKKLLG
ncbi:MAG: transketolase [Polyangiaceae bacterium]|nr:transketolase [Polyangiaceae bacterium]